MCIRWHGKFISTDVLCPGDGNCSNQGVCDVSTGTCTCNQGFQGDMCQSKNFLLLTHVHIMKYLYIFFIYRHSMSWWW